MSEIISRPFTHSTGCERCVFGRGEHASFCRYRWRDGCRCFLPIASEERGEPHAGECPLAKKQEANAA